MAPERVVGRRRLLPQHVDRRAGQLAFVQQRQQVGFDQVAAARDVDGVRCFSGEQGFDDFLAATRILVCLLPLTPQTENILNRGTLGRLQRGGYLINVARGGHLVEADLLALLDEGQLAGASIDVLRQEPPPAEHPFWTHPKIVLTPHTSARTDRDASIEQIAGKIRAIERGEPVAGVVDPVRGY